MKKTHLLLIFFKQGYVAFLLAKLLLLAALTSGDTVHAQYCNPAVVSYLLRDEDGRPMTEEALAIVVEALPKSVGGARVYAGQVSLAEKEARFYEQESVDWPKGKNTTALQFINSESCTMQLGKVTLTYRGKQMRLVFNLVITREQDQRLRRWTIDALPFQEGTFALDTEGWTQYENQVIHADRWRSVPDLIPAQTEAPPQVIRDGRVIFKPVMSELQKTRVPLRLPNYLAAEEESLQLYAVLGEVTPASYDLQVAFTADCAGGNACNYGFVAGERRGVRAKRLRGKPIRLAQGLTGYFTEATCGANCSYSTMSWLQGGYKYTVGIKAAEIPHLREMANSAIANSGGKP